MEVEKSRSMTRKDWLLLAMLVVILGSAAACAFRGFQMQAEHAPIADLRNMTMMAMLLLGTGLTGSIVVLAMDEAKNRQERLQKGTVIVFLSLMLLGVAAQTYKIAVSSDEWLSHKYGNR
jgi:NADH:ubiquinone oxidoreductase subunit 2 (subunit N)